MRFEPPTLTSPWRGRPGDLDGLLSEFFRSELPRQWTPPELPEEQPTLPLPAPKPVRRPAWRSRFALAASVALLLGGAGLLGGKFKDVSSAATRSIGGSDANAKELPKGKNRSPRIREAIEVDKSGQSKFHMEVDLP